MCMMFNSKQTSVGQPRVILRHHKLGSICEASSKASVFQLSKAQAFTQLLAMDLFHEDNVLSH